MRRWYLADMFLIRFALESGQTMGLMILASGLMGRFLVLRRDLTVREARNVRYLDLFAWFGVLIVCIAHATLALSDIGMGAWFYLHNRLEWIEIGLFTMLVLLQIPVAVTLRGWGRYLVRDQVPWYTDSQHDRMVWIGRAQLILVFALPILPPFIRQGIGLPQ